MAIRDGTKYLFIEEFKQIYGTERTPFQNWLICKAQKEVSVVQQDLSYLI